MKNIAVICEYNPFHAGHLIQINKIKEMFKEDSRIIALMSGNAVQRGTPAVYDKYERAKTAVENGVSLVLELPFPYSSSCAEIFASSSVSVAERLGDIDSLVFGSESGDIGYLKTAAERLSSEEFNTCLDSEASENKKRQYIPLKSEVYERLYGDKLPQKPNDILAVEYIRALKVRQSTINPVTYKRPEGFSAGKARAELKEGRESKNLSGIASPCIGDIADEELFGNIMLAFLRKEGENIADLDLEIFDSTAELMGIISKAAENSRDYASFIASLGKTRYTLARIRRVLLYAYCGIKSVTGEPAYTSLLALDKCGREYLSETKYKQKIEILTKPADYRKMSHGAIDDFNRSLAFERLYCLIAGNRQSPGDIQRHSPYIKE